MWATFTAWNTGTLNKSLWNAYTNILHIHLTEYLAYASHNSQMLQRGSSFCKTKQKQFNHKSFGKLYFKKKKIHYLKLFQSKVHYILYMVNYHKLQNCSSFWQNTRDQGSFFISPLYLFLFLGHLQRQIQLNQAKYYIGS